MHGVTKVDSITYNIAMVIILEMLHIRSSTVASRGGAAPTQDPVIYSGGRREARRGNPSPGTRRGRGGGVCGAAVAAASYWRGISARRSPFSIIVFF